MILLSYLPPIFKSLKKWSQEIWNNRCCWGFYLYRDIDASPSLLTQLTRLNVAPHCFSANLVMVCGMGISLMVEVSWILCEWNMHHAAGWTLEVEAPAEGFVCFGESQHFGTIFCACKWAPLQVLGLLCRNHPEWGCLTPRNLMEGEKA